MVFLADEPRSAGFWGGIALGRIVLIPFNIWVGERNVIFLYILLCLALEMVVWFARDLIANGKCRCEVGNQGVFS